MIVGEACNRTVIIVDRDDSVYESARLMREHHVGSVIVTAWENGKSSPVGILTDRDIVIELIAKEIDPAELTVGDVIGPELITVNDKDGVMEALKKMGEKGIRRAPVIDQAGTLIGILAVDDVLELVTEQLHDLTRLIRQEQRTEQRVRN